LECGGLTQLSPAFSHFRVDGESCRFAAALQNLNRTESELVKVKKKKMNTMISVIIPAYNEAVRIGESLKATLAYLNEQEYKCELIVVDDGSTDETAEIAEKIFAENTSKVLTRVIRYEPNRGKGYAVRTGLLAAQGDIALFSDADLSTPITELPKLVEPIYEGELDVTFGSRALDRSLIGVHQPWRREQGGRVFNLIVRLSTRLPIWDTQCGFKAFRMSVCRPLIEASNIYRFGFDVELLYVTYLAGLRLKEIPVRWDHNEGSKVNVWRDSRRMFNEVQIIRRQAKRGLYADGIKASQEIAKSELIRPTVLDTKEDNIADCRLPIADLFQDSRFKSKK
jgi:glycosyltransferase involved in cell wall biosynthesis